MRRITCSFIALALNIHVFCLRAEAEGAILHAMKKVSGMHSEFNISCGGILVASPLQEVLHYKMWTGPNGFDSRNDLVPGG